MDGYLFDALIRSFAAAVPRRVALGGLLGSALAVATGWPMREETAAKKKRKKKKKKRCAPACTGKICGDDGCGGSCGVCSSGQDCTGGTCFCPPARACGATCCPAGTVCAGGICQGPGTCQPTDNLCTTIANCNGNGVCGCLHRFTDGAVLCGTATPDPAEGCAADCENDDDCAAFGAGSFCVKKVGEICCFGPTPINQGFCAVPCPT
jgi:hypothetical protein